MRNISINKAMGYLIPSLLTVSLFISPATTAMPLQDTVPGSSKASQEVTMQPKSTSGNLTKSPALARNTTVKPEPVATATPQKTEDKKTISRCWKRLMNMVREINHAHNNNSK